MRAEGETNTTAAQRSDTDRIRRFNVSEPKYLGAQFDASTTNLTYQIPAPKDAKSSKPLDLTISFLSPITPQSTLRQSVPASYVQISASGSFDIDVYMDLNGLWVTAERDAEIEWDFEEIGFKDTPSLKTMKAKRKHEMKFAEIRDRIEHGKLYITGPTVRLEGFLTEPDTDVR